MADIGSCFCSVKSEGRRQDLAVTRQRQDVAAVQQGKESPHTGHWKQESVRSLTGHEEQGLTGPPTGQKEQELAWPATGCGTEQHCLWVANQLNLW